MKKYLCFAGSFAIAYVLLQILSGVLLTMFYTPTMSGSGASAISSEVEFGYTSLIPQIIIAMAALGSAFGFMKMIGKKVL